MASVNRFNEVLARVRGCPFATVEHYSRVLRIDGVLPASARGTFNPLTPAEAGYLLAAVMRGEVRRAAKNAREVGELIACPTPFGAMLEPVLDHQLAELGWPADQTFARAIGWLIERFADNTISDFATDVAGIAVTVSKYWTTASLRWAPTPRMADATLRGWREAFKALAPLPLPERRPIEIGFHSPHLYEARISYGVDRDRNREAHRKFRELLAHQAQHDLSGEEIVTGRTLAALAELFVPAPCV